MGTASTLSFSPSPFRSRVLYADADRVRSRRVTSALRADGHDVIDIVGPTQLLFATQIVADGFAPAPDAIIVDASLGDGAGLEIIRGLRDLVEESALVLLAPEPDWSGYDDLQPCIVLAGPLDDDDLRTLLLNAPLHARSRAFRRGRAAAPGRG